MIIRLLFHDNGSSLFSPVFTHVNLFKCDGSNDYFVYHNSSGIHIDLYHHDNDFDWDRFYRKCWTIKSVITIHVEGHPNYSRFPIIPSCNEIMRLASNIDVGLSINAIHLYKKIIKYNTLRNYHIINIWNRKDGI